MNEVGTGRLSDRFGRIGARVGVLLFATLGLGQTLTEDFAPIDSWARATGAVLVIVCTSIALLIQNSSIRRHTPRGATSLTISVLVLTCLTIHLTGAWSIAALAVACVMSTQWGGRIQLASLILCGLVNLLSLALLNGLFEPGLAFLMAIAAVSGFVIHSLTRLVVVVDELRLAREQLARVHVDQERQRISRDLHDILGRTLVAVALRNETALRLMGRDDKACRDQLMELRSTVTDGQAQLRELTSGPTIVGLASELVSAQELLGRLGVRLTVSAVEVEEHGINQVFAAVVRESVTNMLKHSRPTQCKIGIRRESLALVATIVNDKALPEDSGSAGGQTGLRDLEARISALGGVLNAGRAAGGHFRVIARIPTMGAVEFDDLGAPGATARTTTAAALSDDASTDRQGDTSFSHA